MRWRPGEADFDNHVRVWDVDTGAELRKFEGHTARVTGVAFAPDGRTLVSGSHDGTVRIWDVEHGVQLRVLATPGDEVTSLALAADGRVMIAGAGDHWGEYRDSRNQGLLTLWNIETGVLLRRFEALDLR